MTTLSFKDLYEAAEQGGTISVPEGVYDLEVEDTGIKVDTRVIFLESVVLSGPAQGTKLSLNLSIPNENSKRGAFYHFNRKIAGFLGQDLKAAFEAAESAPTAEASLSAIADALVGKRVTATISVQKDGQYKGSNQLDETKPLSGGAPAPAPNVTQQVEPQPVAANSDSPAVPF